MRLPRHSSIRECLCSLLAGDRAFLPWRERQVRGGGAACGGAESNDPETLADVGHYLAFMGEFERGAELSRRAQQLNPLYPSWYNFSFARLYYHQKRYEDAVVDVQHAGLPHFYWTHLRSRPS